MIAIIIRAPSDQEIIMIIRMVLLEISFLLYIPYLFLLSIEIKNFRIMNETVFEIIVLQDHGWPPFSGTGSAEMKCIQRSTMVWRLIHI